MPQREYEITIGADGGVKVHIVGFKGKACLETVRNFEQMVGKLASLRETDEFYAPDEEVRLRVDQRH